MINLSRHEIEALIDLPNMGIAIEKAYRATSAGQVNLPPVGHITFPDRNADCHIKYGHMENDENFVIKVATGFAGNVDRDLPTGNGLVLVLSAETGQVRAVLHDEMLLTDIRTGLGGAIASRLLAKKGARKMLVIGTGPQARWQVVAHKALMPELEVFALWGRNEDRAAQTVEALSTTCDIRNAVDLEFAVSLADIIVTATGSTAAIVDSSWVRPGTHITAIGADAPGKQELDKRLVSRADILVADHMGQCADHGEFSHALKAQTIKTDDFQELGAVLEKPALGRENDNQITIADLTGIAAQDIAIANSVLASWRRKAVI